MVTIWLINRGFLAAYYLLGKGPTKGEIMSLMRCGRKPQDLFECGFANVLDPIFIAIATKAIVEEGMEDDLLRYLGSHPSGVISEVTVGVIRWIGHKKALNGEWRKALDRCLR